MQNDGLHKKYGLFTAIAMVIGIVIGSGVFFKAEKILDVTGGNLPIAILAWAIGGVIMVICAATFAVMATKYEKVNGLVDYAEATVGKGYGYFVGWFTTIVYLPALTSVLAWLSARYTAELFGWNLVSPQVMALTAFFIVGAYALNALSPKLSGKFQVSTTVIKLIPLLAMAIVGTIAGLINGTTVANFTSVVSDVDTGSALFTAVCATAFAYEGWIIATSINAELKNAKRNLPLALVGGTLAIVAIYILYYVGIAGACPTGELILKDASGNMVNGAPFAFKEIFGNIAGTVLTVFVAISCMGTLNGLMLGCTRGIYSLAARDRGPKPQMFSEVSKTTNMPTNSSIFGLLLVGFWWIYFYSTQLTDSWFGAFKFDSSELPIITLYAMYIPIFIKMMMKEKDFGVFKRFILPILAIISSLFMIAACIVSHKLDCVWYLILFALIMGVGIIFYNRKSKTDK